MNGIEQGAVSTWTGGGAALSRAPHSLIGDQRFVCGHSHHGVPVGKVPAALTVALPQPDELLQVVGALYATGSNIRVAYLPGSTSGLIVIGAYTARW